MKTYAKVKKKSHIQQTRDFPGSPVVRTSFSNAMGVGLIPGKGAGIPCALQPKNKTLENRSNIAINSIKTFKMVYNNNQKKSLKQKNQKATYCQDMKAT